MGFEEDFMMMVMKKGMKWRCKVVYYWCKSLGGGGKGRRSCLWLVFKEVSLQPTKNNNEPPPQLVFTALYFLLSSCCGRIWRWAVSVCVVTSQIYWPLTSTNFAQQENNSPVIWSEGSGGYRSIQHLFVPSASDIRHYQSIIINIRQNTQTNLYSIKLPQCHFIKYLILYYLSLNITDFSSHSHIFTNT